MCGRFGQFSDIDVLRSVFPIDQVDCILTPNYNTAPTHEVLVILRKNGINHLERCHWGLVPFWAKDTSIGSRLINARAETVAKKPSFRDAFKKRRCLIITDGFFEWKGPKGSKLPHFITLPSGKPFAFAGLWDRWQKEDKEYKSCTIITTSASDDLADIHHRMPVILGADLYDAWLDPDQNADEVLEKAVEQGQSRKMKRYEVSKRVNSVGNNDPACLEPLEEADKAST